MASVDDEEFARLSLELEDILRDEDQRRADMLFLERKMCDKFRMLREQRGWSQKDLADRVRSYGLDFHQSTIAKLEAHKRPLRVAEMYALSHVFRLPPGAVFFMAYDTGEDRMGIESLEWAINDSIERIEYSKKLLSENITSTIEGIVESQIRLEQMVDAMHRVAGEDPAARRAILRAKEAMNNNGERQAEA